MDPNLFLVLAVASGLILGSFSTACVHRWLNGISIARPARSFCPDCGTTLTWKENIPVVSYLVQRGRCRHCGVSISARYPALELLAAAWATALALRFGPSAQWIIYMVFGTAFLIMSFIDLEAFVLPDAITLPGIPAAFAASWLVLGMGWKLSLWGAILGGGLFFAVQLLYRVLRGREGLGTGDVKLMFLIGALVGPMGLPFVVLASAIMGLLSSLVWLLGPGAKGLQTRIPFGPFLCLGCMLYILFGRAFWRWFL